MTRHHSDSNRLTTINRAHGEVETAWRHIWDRSAPGMTALAPERPMDRVPAAADPRKRPLLASEELAILLDRLEDDTLRQVAVMRLISATNEEIAQVLRLSLRTVQRKIQVIAKRWREVAQRDSMSLRELWQAFEPWRQIDEPS